MNFTRRTIIIGVVVWLLFFGWWFKGYLSVNWNFHLFSFHSWAFVINEFRQGWRLSNIGDWIFLISFILSGPVFCLLWYLANKVFWLNVFKRSYRCTKRTIKKVCKKQNDPSFGYYPSVKPTANIPNKAQRPVKMASLAGGMLGSSQTHKTPTFNFNPTPTQPAWTAPVAKEPEASFPVNQPFYQSQGDFKEIAETPLSEVELPQVESVNEDIADILSKSGYRVFENVVWQEKKVDWLGVANHKIWMAIYDDETGDWLADEEAFNDEDPLWFSETDHRISPIFELKQMQKQLKDVLAELGVEIQPVLIERRGNLINAEDMMKTWNDLGVVVCRTNVGGPVELPVVSEVLKDKQEAVNNETLQKLSAIFNLGEKING